MSNFAPLDLFTLSSAPDRDLVATAAQGLEGGFEELVRRYQRPISGYVYRMVGDYDAALDLTQEIFIKIYGSLTRYRPEFKFSTWIYRLRTTPRSIISAEARDGNGHSRPAPSPKTMSCRSRAMVSVRNSKASVKSGALKSNVSCVHCRRLIVNSSYYVTRRI